MDRRHLVDHAASRANFIRIDMEHSGLVDQTLGIYRRLRTAGRDSVGTVLQAYLYRTPGDLSALVKNMITRGWYESTPLLGAPYGQKLYDFPLGTGFGRFATYTAFDFAAQAR